MPKHSAQRPSSPTPSELSIASSYWDQFFPPEDAAPPDTHTLSHRPSSPTLGQSPKVTIRPEPIPLSSYAVTDPRWKANSQDLDHSVSAEQVARLRRVPKEGKGLDGQGRERMRVLKRSDHLPSRGEWPVERRRGGAGGTKGKSEHRREFESVTPPRVDSAKDVFEGSAVKTGGTGKAETSPQVRMQILADAASDRKAPKSASVMVAGLKVKSGNARAEHPKAVANSSTTKVGPAGQAQAMYTVRVKVVVPETSSSKKHRLRRVAAREDLSRTGANLGK